jgi:hypothetical protein
MELEERTSNTFISFVYLKCLDAIGAVIRDHIGFTTWLEALQSGRLEKASQLLIDFPIIIQARYQGKSALHFILQYAGSFKPMFVGLFLHNKCRPDEADIALAQKQYKEALAAFQTTRSSTIIEAYNQAVMVCQQLCR